MRISGDAEKAASGVELLVLDLDGVLTDGGIVYPGEADEVKAFSVRDGFGLRCWREAGKKSAVVTGRGGAAVARRCRELGVDVLIEGMREKGAAYRSLLERLEVPASAVCAMGDDLPDLPMLLASGVGAAPADAAAEVRDAASVVTSAAGGRGAVRELIEWILARQGLWPSIVERYRRPA